MPKLSKFLLINFLLCILVHLILYIYTSNHPKLVASHFDGNNNPNGFLQSTDYCFFSLLVCLIFSVTALIIQKVNRHLVLVQICLAIVTLLITISTLKTIASGASL